MNVRRATPFLVVGLGLLLAGCGAAGPAPTVTTTVTATPRPSASASSSTAGATVLGTCPPSRGDDAYRGSAVSVVTAPVDTEVSVTVDAFDPDGTITKVTRTVRGPVASFVSYPCSDAAGSAQWTLTATVPEDAQGPVTCALFFAGQQVKTDTVGGEDQSRLTADCTGNPGGR